VVVSFAGDALSILALSAPISGVPFSAAPLALPTVISSKVQISLANGSRRVAIGPCACAICSSSTNRASPIEVSTSPA